jgi:Ni/Co efflux regulator RcnB
MNRPLLALALLLACGAMANAASAQEARYAYPDPIFHNGDADNDSIPNAEDPVDDRFDASGNPVRFEVGQQLPADSYGNATEVDWNVRGLRQPPAGTAWHRMGDNYYLVALGDGRVVDAVYNLRD